MDTNISTADRPAPVEPAYLDDDVLAAIRERDVNAYRADADLGGGLLTNGSIDRHLLLAELARLHAVLVRQGLVISRTASQPALISAIVSAAVELVELPSAAFPGDLEPLRAAVAGLISSVEESAR